MTKLFLCCAALLILSNCTGQFGDVDREANDIQGEINQVGDIMQDQSDTIKEYQLAVKEMLNVPRTADIYLKYSPEIERLTQKTVEDSKPRPR